MIDWVSRPKFSTVFFDRHQLKPEDSSILRVHCHADPVCVWIAKGLNTSEVLDCLRRLTLEL